MMSCSSTAGQGLYQPIDLGIGRCRTRVAVRLLALIINTLSAAAQDFASQPNTPRRLEAISLRKAFDVDLIKA
jgi:hypothetical protein